jgi:hypothetical protein
MFWVEERKWKQIEEKTEGSQNKTLTLMGNVENKLTVKARYAPLQQSLLNYH